MFMVYFISKKMFLISVVEEISGACGTELQRRSKTQTQLKELYGSIHNHLE